MRSLVMAVALVGGSSLGGAAHAEPVAATDLGTERTVDLASGMTVAGAATEGGDIRPGLALAIRYYGAGHLYLSGAVGASLAVDGAVPEQSPAATLLSVGGGAGLCGEHGAWTGYGGARAEWVKNIDWPNQASRDPDWFTSGVGAGPSIALARRVGTAWGHPMAIELSASYMLYSLRRPDVYVIQILPPGDAPPPAELDGLEVGLFLAGTLFPDRPL